MAKLPPISRLVTEDFADQKSWIGKLLQPVNQFMESVFAALNQGLTIKDNTTGDILTAELDGTLPLKLSWSGKSKPTVVLVGDIYRSDGSTVTLTAAVGIKWSFNQSGQLQIDTVLGLPVAASASVKYKITLICFTG